MKNQQNPLNKNTLITYSILFIVFILDKLSKHLITVNQPINIDVAHTTYSQATPYIITSWFWLIHVVNFGAAFSIFYGKTYLLIGFVSLIVTSIFVYERNTYKHRPLLLSAALGCIIAGALGNLTDRIQQGYVTDFFALINNGKPIWPIFNVADISVNVGVGLFILSFLILEFKGKKPAPAEVSATQKAEDTTPLQEDI
jgi:signal peptidase II